jgi:hypothetical protein
MCSPSERFLGKIECDTRLGSNTQLYAQENPDVAIIITIISKKDVVMDKVPKQPMTHIDTQSIKTNHQSSYKR